MKRQRYCVCIKTHVMDDGRVSHDKGAIYPMTAGRSVLKTGKNTENIYVEHSMVDREYFDKYFVEIEKLSDAKAEVLRAEKTKLDRGGEWSIAYGEVLLQAGEKSMYITQSDINLMQEAFKK